MSRPEYDDSALDGNNGDEESDDNNSMLMSLNLSGEPSSSTGYFQEHLSHGTEYAEQEGSEETDPAPEAESSRDQDSDAD
jgi:hypothetical protein